MKLITAKEARQLMTGQFAEDPSVYRQILLQEYIDKLKTTIYSEIEKEATRGNPACYISIPKNKHSIERQAISIIQEDLHKQGYDSLIESNLFRSLLHISW